MVPHPIERVSESAGECGGVSVRDEEPITSVAHDFLRATHRRCDHGRAARKGFEEYVRPALGLRGEHGDIGGAEPAPELGLRARPGEDHSVLETAPLDLALQPLSIALAGP